MQITLTLGCYINCLYEIQNMLRYSPLGRGACKVPTIPVTRARQHLPRELKKKVITEKEINVNCLVYLIVSTHDDTWINPVLKFKKLFVFQLHKQAPL